MRGWSTHILPIDSKRSRANSWHTDVTFVDRIPSASILRAIQLPPYGGTTTWANTAAAYQALPDPLRHLADRLWAVHTNAFDYAAEAEVVSDELDERLVAYRKEFRSLHFETEHPVVRVHPEEQHYSSCSPRTLVPTNLSRAARRSLSDSNTSTAPAWYSSSGAKPPVRTA